MTFYEHAHGGHMATGYNELFDIQPVLLAIRVGNGNLTATT